jgi:hypothetical protein
MEIKTLERSKTKYFNSLDIGEYFTINREPKYIFLKFNHDETQNAIRILDKSDGRRVRSISVSFLPGEEVLKVEIKSVTVEI